MQAGEDIALDARMIEWAFGRAVAQRGRQYFAQTRVVEWHREGDEIHSTVQGSAARPYEQVIRVRNLPQHRTPLIQARCTCAYANDCKHAAAVLYAIMARKGTVPITARSATAAAPAVAVPQPAVTGELGAWLARLERAIAGHDGPAAPPVAHRIVYVIRASAGKTRI